MKLFSLPSFIILLDNQKDKVRRFFLIAILRSRAAQQKAEKRLGGAQRLSEASVFCEQHRVVPLCGIKELAAIFGSFLGKQK